jgi:predicted enzyme related to lactoylglutathione lyase
MSAVSNGETDMVRHHGRFIWYELITTDIAAAAAFYAEVVGWGAQDASTPELAYTLFVAGTATAGGLMELPEHARKMGATPRWVGYVSVEDADMTAERIERLGGAVYVPPTNSNIGRVSVIADPQTASLGLVEGLRVGEREPAGQDQPGCVGWHELLADDPEKAFAFYGEVFGWRKADAESGPTDAYQLFAAGEQTIGGMSTKLPIDPVPFWLLYFNVADIDAAVTLVKSGGGRIFDGPHQLLDGSWIARCVDPQGAFFALQGMRSRDAGLGTAEVGWSSEWSGISSRGRLITRPRR